MTRRAGAHKYHVPEQTVLYVELALSWQWSPEQISSIGKRLGERCGSAPSEMCLLVKTRFELAGKDETLCRRAHSHLKNTEQLFTRLLDQARDNGELAAGTDTRVLARHLQIQLMGLRSYKACNGDTATIESAIDHLFTGHI